MVDLSGEDKFEFIGDSDDYKDAIELGVRVLCKCGELKYSRLILRINKTDIKQLINDLSKEIKE